MHSTPNPSDSLRSGCEDVIRRFEDAWRRPGRPDLAAFLPDGPPPPTDLLVELVHIDLEFRFRNGDEVRIEEYLARFPVLAADAVVLDLIRAEYALRARHRPPVTPDDFRRRFPDRADDIQTLVCGPDQSGGLTPTRAGDAAAEPLTVPLRVPGYEVVGEIGRGGMGVVYLAHDLTLRRMVAVKTMASVPVADSRARFAREAEAIAALDHPHIVPVYEVGEWTAAAGLAPVPFFVMKYCPGGSLDATPAGAGTDLAAHARTVAVVARAVHHAHQRGVLHRDLKPCNILLDDAGRPHVADFGLAGRFDPADPRTQTAAVVGTPAYMAPEQARSPKEVTTAADVYGLGAVLYHRITGRPPFQGATPLSTLELVTTEPPTRPAALNPAVPRDLETICLKCLEKDASRRYATAAELADDLDRWRTGRPVLARPPRPWEHGWRWVRRHPLVAGMGATTAAALFLSVVVLAESNAQIRAKEQETNKLYLRECALRYKLTDALAREKQTLYLERVTSAGRLVAANQLPQAWRLLDQCPDEYRGWEWKHLDGIRRAAPPALAGHTDAVGAVAFLADGRLVSVDTGGQARVWDATGSAPTRTWQISPEPVAEISAHPHRNWVVAATRTSVAVWDVDTGNRVRTVPGAGRAAFSGCGRWLAAADGRVARLWSVPGWEPHDADTRHDADVSAVAFTPDGERFLTGTTDGSVHTWLTETAGPVGVPWRRPRGITGLAFTADGQTLIEAHAEGVVLADPMTGRHRSRLSPTAAGRAFAAVGPDPAWVAVVGPDREVIVWDCGRGRAVRTLRGHTARVSALAFSRDGKRLASAGGDQIVRVWDLAREPGGRTLAEPGTGAESLAVSADGTRVVVGPRPGAPRADHFTVVNVSTGQAERVVPATGGVALSPDGRRVAAGRAGGGVAVWDAASGAEAWHRTDPDYAGGGARLAFTADGTRLASWTPGGGCVRITALATGETRDLSAGARTVRSLAFSPDGSRLAVAGSDGVTVIEEETGKSQTWADAPREAYAVAFSPDGSVLVVAEPGAVRMRSVRTGQIEQSFVGGPLRVNAVAVGPNASRLVTGGADGTVRVWDTASGQELVTLLSGGDPVTGVAWAGDRVFATAGGTFRVWGLD
ncbi:MAG TPA: protein kinase [Urbifossiella sp.]|nr:protein kinase [Urbifossiella sp.]